MSNNPKKFDLQGLINSVKTMINPESNIPTVDPNDAIGVKIAELSTLIQQLVSAQAEHNKELTRANQLLLDLFKDIEQLRGSTPTKSA